MSRDRRLWWSGKSSACCEWNRHNRAVVTFWTHTGNDPEHEGVEVADTLSTTVHRRTPGSTQLPTTATDRLWDPFILSNGKVGYSKEGSLTSKGGFGEVQWRRHMKIETYRRCLACPRGGNGTLMLRPDVKWWERNIFTFWCEHDRGGGLFSTRKVVSPLLLIYEKMGPVSSDVTGYIHTALSTERPGGEPRDLLKLMELSKNLETPETWLSLKTGSTPTWRWSQVGWIYHRLTGGNTKENNLMSQDSGLTKIDIGPKAGIHGI